MIFSNRHTNANILSEIDGIHIDRVKDVMFIRALLGNSILIT